MPKKSDHEANPVEEEAKKFFMENHKDLFDALPPWMQQFFGLQSLSSFIFNRQEDRYEEKNIKLLIDLAETYDRYTTLMVPDTLQTLQKQCLKLEKTPIANRDTALPRNNMLFMEWFESLEDNRNSNILDFKAKHEIYRSRDDTDSLVKLQKKMKEQLPNLEFNQDDTEENVEKGKQLGLNDFNQISAKENPNEIRERFTNLINPKQ